MTDINIPDPVEHTTVVEAPNEAIDHVVRHEGRLTDLENTLKQQREEVFQAIESTRTDLYAAIESSRLEQASMLENKLTRLEELANKLEKQIEQPPQELLNGLPQEVVPQPANVVPEIETVESAKVHIPKGMRERRKARHKKQ